MAFHTWRMTCLLFDRPTREFSLIHVWIGEVTIFNEGLTHARYSWPLNSEGSLAWHTYCDTGHPFKWSSPRTRNTHTYCRAFSSGAACFYD